MLLLYYPLASNAIPDVSLEIHRFHSSSSPFIELSIYIVGSSLSCKPEVSIEYGVEYVVVIKDSTGNVVTGSRYRLTQKECPAKDLIDLRRFALAPGSYNVELDMTDILDSTNNVTIQQNIVILSEADDSKLSDIQLLSAVKKAPDGVSPLHKSGLYLEPLPFRYYYPSITNLNLYIESYGGDKLAGTPYLQYELSATSGNIPPPIIAYRKVAKQPIAANVFQLDIQKLISGRYTLEASLFDGNKKLIASRKIQFARYNPEGDSIFIETGSLSLENSFVTRIPEDSLDYILKAMAPVVNSVEVDIMNLLLQKGNSRAKEFFIHRYWTEEAGKYSEQAYVSYMKVAHFVDDLFRSGFGYGFETDRGHIFLKYGKPGDIIEVEDEPSAPPYEIWIYDQFPVTHQTNVRFLFYNPSLARNGHKLLHSTAIGETKNSRWEIELYRDATLEAPGVNDKEMGDNVHRNARKYFENF